MKRPRQKGSWCDRGDKPSPIGFDRSRNGKEETNGRGERAGRSAVHSGSTACPWPALWPAGPPLPQLGDHPPRRQRNRSGSPPLQRLAAAGLLTVTRDGNQKHYQAHRDSPVFLELHGLVVKTVGLLEPIRAALEPLAGKIDAAFVYGSLAKGSDRATSDVDLLVLSDRVEYPELFEAMQNVEAVLARPVNPTVMKRAQWKRKRAGRDSFAARIADQPKLFVIGGEDDLR